MLKYLTPWLPALALPAGCSSRSYERQALTGLIQRYGDDATLQPGYNFTTRPSTPQGSHLRAVKFWGSYHQPSPAGQRPVSLRLAAAAPAARTLKKPLPIPMLGSGF